MTVENKLPIIKITKKEAEIINAFWHLTRSPELECVIDVFDEFADVYNGSEGLVRKGEYFNIELTEEE